LTEFLAITKDITKRKEAEEKLSKHYELLDRTNKELDRTNKELDRTNKELDRFVYSASHDIRAPLTSVMGIVNLSKIETKSKKMYNYLDMIEQSVKRLDKFVIDIISYSRNTRLDVQKEKIDFDVLISDIILDLRYIEGTGKIEIKKSIDESIPFYSDKSRLRIIFNNLISNAIRYHKLNQDNPYIDIVVSISKEKAKIQIKDNGIGIDREDIDKIFDMFFKISNSNNSTGSGLGLYIVKETIDKLDGTISIESELKKGSSFTIEIPNK
jgi:signal transduction histidine kinase